MQLTITDHQAMHRQGYCLDLHDDGFRLKRIPASTVFKDDAAAWVHVMGAGAAGCPLAMATLAFLREHGPLEFQIMARYASLYAPAVIELGNARLQAKAARGSAHDI